MSPAPSLVEFSIAFLRGVLSENMNNGTESSGCEDL